MLVFQHYTQVMIERAPIKLLVVDDDEIIAESLKYVLSKRYDVTVSNDAQSVATLIDSGYSADVALVDLGLPPDTHKPDEGFKVISMLQASSPATNIIVLSGQDQKGLVAQAKKLGADDFIAKPCDIAEIKMRLQLQHKEMTEFDGIVGKSQVVDLLRMQIKQFADSPYPVLIEGASGCGKELTAKNLHEQSGRSISPYLSINCAAFNGELLESQLFGHVKGAFTGANESKIGFFEETKNGTFFLDEVADLDIELQSKLLRVLENQEFYRIGETKPRYSQARIVAATNKNLYEQVQKGLFREDLYHRLSVLTVRVPSVAERESDKLLLLDFFQQELGEPPMHFMLDEQAKNTWVNYEFPGNVRELKNIVIRLMAKYPGQTLSPEVIKVEFMSYGVDSGQQFKHKNLESELLQENFQLDERLKHYEKEYVALAIRLSNGNMSKAAQLLGINRSTLYGRMDKKN